MATVRAVRHSSSMPFAAKANVTIPAVGLFPLPQLTKLAGQCAAAELRMIGNELPQEKYLAVTYVAPAITILDCIRQRKPRVDEGTVMRLPR
jgi:hypothetical protein